MLEGDYREAKTNVITFRDISGAVLERVVQYFHFKHRYTNSVEDIPTFPIDPEFALELLMAANFLDT
jgi:transcription elongation factor B subunit 1